ncbi:hypothetical protein TWF481_005316 [Arthrobotrys musiformis]|uniref:Uncharacterized protein n=1 Tax=Arthrobotrys musiformis TaxID=47236 RepID=A0AAV9WEM3_9PEZI
MIPQRVISLLALGVLSMQVSAIPVPQLDGKGLTQDQIDTAYINQAGYITFNGKGPAKSNDDILGGKFASVVEDSDYAYGRQYQEEGKSVLVGEPVADRNTAGEKIQSYEEPASEPYEFYSI